MSLQCSDLNEVVGLLREIPCSNELTLLQVLLAHSWRGLGRVGTSKALKMSERRVRKIIECLKANKIVNDSGSVNKDSLKKLLDILKVKTIKTDKGLYITAYTPLSKNLLEMAASRIVELRDYLVIGTGSSSTVWMIGVSLGSPGGIMFPRVPTDYVEEALKGVNQEGLENSLVIVWRVYEEIIFDSVVLYSLAQLCASS
ncbi:hypothetical protein [Thermosphaera aggregans]|uniref:DUF4443 domain-containing protein n=1 Tax=Thermosphaera aggregans (strain DSM 11486 / M11TL) TaxID=633148 RepID=D5U2J4_THEAM|nr:hypothetical protein [Thermosphaera aggregans]ADG91344.1 hypothetical protein Tagg_1075 [Thermosphaera aggregans DSM 11486]